MADKVYIATLTQTSTNAPVATELANTVGAIVWSRSSSGVYVGTLASAFSPLASTTISLPVMTNVVSAVVTDINSVTITCSGDGVLSAREVAILVSTHYCTFTDLEKRLSRKNLAGLCNDTANSTVADPVIIEQILTNVNSIIDAKAGQVYTVPFTTIPDKVKQIAIDFACFQAMQRRPANMPMPKEWDDANKAAMKDLEDISNMLLRLPDTATIASAESDMVTPTTDPLVDFNDSTNDMSQF